MYEFNAANHVPNVCVECGRECDHTVEETVTVTVSVNGEPREVPGLERCKTCHGRVTQDMIPSNVGQVEALEWLTWYVPAASLYAASVMAKPRSEVSVEEVYALVVARNDLETCIELGNDLSAELAAGLGVNPPAAATMTADEAEGLAKAIDIRREDDGTYSYICPGCGERESMSNLLADDDLPGELVNALAMAVDTIS